MITAIYASLSALLIVRLSLSVIKLRRKNRVSVGDGGNEALQLAIRAHANAVEYIPIALMLLFMLEFNGAPKLLVHILGVTLLIGRVLHAMGLPAKDLRRRVLGMQITVYLLIGLAVLNILFLFPAVAGMFKL
ncbi:MAG: MAPEG family protein [Methylobacter sp.]